MYEDSIEVYFGGYAEGGHHLRGTRGSLIVERDVARGTHRPDGYSITPSREAWDRFWFMVDSLDVWSWGGEYREVGVATGVNWYVHLQSGEREIEASGLAAYPPGARVDEFIDAVSELVGMPFLEGGARRDVIGAEVCEAGWLGVVLRSGRFHRAVRAASLVELVDQDVDVIAAHVPIGFPRSGVRRADTEARCFVEPFEATVLPAPPREALAASKYSEANKLTKAVTGEELSKEIWMLRRRILEVDQVRRQAHDLIFEAHPEVSFRALAGRPLRYSAESLSGHRERLGLLREAGIEISDDLGEAGAVFGPRQVLDATVAAWSARRISISRYSTLPSEPETDADDESPVAIWF